ncbi:mitochondrial potassium channel-like [Tubulanus polymorphus]|uniref:mitochondrial potassium channel-like n=1 Tax=Tubulanus polymorphus TaxID=672921 RepID=UPI003DA431AB
MANMAKTILNLNKRFLLSVKPLPPESIQLQCTRLMSSNVTQDKMPATPPSAAQPQAAAAAVAADAGKQKPGIVAKLVDEAVSNQKVSGIMMWYEDFIGLTDVKTAQQNVLEAERNFAEAQEKRREQQQILTQVQSKLKDIDHELDKTPRGDDRFLELLKDQHALYRQEVTTHDKHAQHEKDERSYFTELCTAVRDSHEKERARTERTKYWSILGSMVGAFIGILGATVNNFLRNREIRKLGKTVERQHDEIESILVDFKNNAGIVGLSTRGKPDESVTVKLGDSSNDVSQLLQNQDKHLKKQIAEIKQIVLSSAAAGAAGAATDSSIDSRVVYIGPQIHDMLNDTEKNLEYKIKINSLATVAFVYGALAVAVPILYAVFRGS